MDKMRQKKRELQNKYNETKLEDCDSNNELMEPVSNSFFFCGYIIQSTTHTVENLRKEQLSAKQPRQQYRHVSDPPKIDGPDLA